MTDDEKAQAVVEALADVTAPTPIKVLYRTYFKHKDIIDKDKPEVVALFIDEPYADPRNWWLITCYVHMGQHGGADYFIVRDRTRPSTPAEIEPLERELIDRGYAPRTMQRWTRRRN